VVDRRDGQTLIFFFDFRGILDSFSGFVCSTGNTKPQSGDFGGQFIEIEETPSGLVLGLFGQLGPQSCRRRSGPLRLGQR
jgi:hypothetical protein